MKRLISNLCAPALMLCTAGAARAHADTCDDGSGATSDEPVLAWNVIAIDTVAALPPFPMARAMAITQLAVFEAVDSISLRYEPYLGEITASPGASAEAAAITAAHDALVGLFPDAAATLDPKLIEALEALPDGEAKDAGVNAGEDAAASLLEERADDGSAPPRFYQPSSDDPGDWQPTPSCTAAGGAFLHWQDVEPFGIESSSQFRADAPFPLDSAEYARDFNEVKTLGAADSTERPQDRADVARIYAAQPPAVGWNSFARQLASTRHDDITETARAFALLNASISDALVSVFDTKYHYTTWRPETAIARADEDGNPDTQADASFTPFIVTPCFPSYPSAHGAGSNAGHTVLAALYGEGGHELTNSDPSVPDVVLHYDRLDQIVLDVSDARVYGGIHFRNDQDAGERMGRHVAQYNLEHLLRELEDDWDD